MVGESSNPNRFPVFLAGIALATLLIANLPGFLCMGLDCDTVAFDLYLRGMQEGKVLYRDMTENNLPGVMWVHSLTRSLLGWSSIAMRSVDLLLVGGAFLLLAWWQRGIGLSSRLWILTFLFSYYFSTSEWVHCQRDPWMVLPAMGALFLRRSQLEANSAGVRGSGTTLYFGILEGMLWGMAVWLKPYVVVPAAMAWAVGSIWFCRSDRFSLRAFGVDLTGLLMGGMLAGIAGIWWMKSQGCWEPYLEHIASLGNDYLSADMYRPLTITDYRLFQILRFYPWCLLILGAVLFGAVYLAKGLMKKSSHTQENWISDSLLLSLLLGFFLEGVFLQHVFDYTVVPAAFLALTWVGNRVAGCKLDSERMLLGFLCGLTVFMGLTPILKQRLPIWDRCIIEGSTWEIRNHLNILDRVSWSDLKRVRDFLQSQQILDGELTVVTEAALPLYEEMGLRPPTKSTMMTNQLFSFPSRREETFAALSQSKQRFAITSTDFLKLDRDNLYERPAKEHESLPNYWHGSRDWTKYVVFRAGHYVVLEFPGALMSDWCREVLGL